MLEPRPWTALQGCWAARLSMTLPDGPMLELCSGVGHIGLVAASRSNRSLIQIDANPLACAFARSNADAAGLGGRVEVRCERLETMTGSDETFPLIIADPPYVPTSDVHRYPADPTATIDGGPDGFDLIQQCLDVIGAVMAPGGTALLQLGSTHQIERIDQGRPGGLIVTDHKADRSDRHVVRIERAPGHERAGDAPADASGGE